MDRRAVVIAAPDGVICFWNARAEALFGHTALHAIGRPLDLIIPPEYHQAHWAGFWRAMKSGAAEAEGRPGPFPALHANGEITPRNGMVTLLRGPGGDLVGAMAVFD